MGRCEDGHARAERRFREGEARSARLIPMMERLERTGHGWAEARRVLADFEAALDLSRGLRRSGRAPSAGRTASDPGIQATAPRPDRGTAR